MDVLISDPYLAGASDEAGGGAEMEFLGTLVIRTWAEQETQRGFRARISISQDPRDEPNIIATADPDEVLDIVRRWLSAQTRRD
ncbi:hypothetical protein NFC73_11440 [Pseudarthrobacter sp. RMG13]|uniref:Uncharacterized protein n=1 Tax=Pseudarthrobacter humi TaxID=2952523 RepID=A0ABT1LPF3_9MICC|nr:hypothetical protein [Pseudarthrobacter humi]MCP9000337.1 hypothetical protein [Pseudarthrobacter humi]